MVDFGLVVLIWLVQLIIYPSFARIDRNVFIAWHGDYTRWITVIVAPLMFAQLFLSIWQLTSTQHVTSWIRLLLVVAVWLLTFFQAVPLHNQLNNEGNTTALTESLVTVNWPRTILWTLIFVLGLIRMR